MSNKLPLSSKLWLPGQADSGQPDSTSVVIGKIVSAKYHADLGQIAVLVKMPDGSNRSTVIHKSTVTFAGRRHDDIPIEDVHHEMQKTADLFRKSKGRSIKIELYENQA